MIAGVVKMLSLRKIYLSTLLLAGAMTLALGSAASEEYPHISSFPNGMTVTIHAPDRIMEEMVHYDIDGRMILDIPGGGQYHLVEDISDPVIVNKGDGQFHPFDAEQVLAAIGGIEAGGAWMGMEIEVYILPLPRRFIQTSSTVGLDVFLSPGVLELSAELTACVVTHEVGHCVQNRFMTDSEGTLWNEYVYIRGIGDEAVFAPTAEHMYRPAEIFAEDFRFLFGCQASRYSGTIENPYIAMPGEVEGLEEFMVSLFTTDISVAGPVPVAQVLSAYNYPNPFNPTTTISVEVGGEREVPLEIEVYGADGRLIRRLYSGSAPPGMFSVAWDGRGESGMPLSSGAYFYSVRSGAHRTTGKMILLR